jgi:hypothetical protein
VCVKAFDYLSRRPHALERLLFTSDPQRSERFAREARLLAPLDHPDIATIHGVRVDVACALCAPFALLF